MIARRTIIEWPRCTSRTRTFCHNLHRAAAIAVTIVVTIFMVSRFGDSGAVANLAVVVVGSTIHPVVGNAAVYILPVFYFASVAVTKLSRTRRSPP